MTFTPARILILALALALAAPHAGAQQGGARKGTAKKSDKPEKAPPKQPEEPKLPPPPSAEPESGPKDAKAAEKSPSSGGEDPLAKVFGEGGMDLKSEGINAEFNPETGEMTSMHIWGGVNLVSQLMNLDCEDIVIDMVKQEMTAKGKLVKFKKQDVEGTCGRLLYNIETKKTYLTGPPKPIVKQKQPNGSIRETRAEKITMIQNDKTNNILWDGNVEFNIMPAPSAPKANGPAKKPEKINDGNVGAIRNPSVDN